MSKCKECDGRGKVDSSYTVNVRSHQKGSGEVLTTESCNACEGLGYFAETEIRPQNCGTSFCSCIECLYPAPKEQS